MTYIYMIIALASIALASYFRIVDGAAPWYLVIISIAAVIYIAIGIATVVSNKHR